MKTKVNNSTSASALQAILSVALISISAIMLAGAVERTVQQRSQDFSAGETPEALGNYPNTIISLGDNITVTPTAAPTNTTSINVSSSTNFNGTLEANPATGVVRVTDAHPAGTYTVTVKAFNGGTVNATKTFTLTVTTPLTCTLAFAAQDLSIGTHGKAVALGDFNGDGNQDVAEAGSTRVSIFLGDGAGNFLARPYLNLGAESLAVGDFNGDGNQDIVTVAFADLNNVTVYLGDGTGNFGPRAFFTAGSAPFSVAVGDVNHDGKEDIVAANAGSDDVSVLLGNGARGFTAATNFAAGTEPQSIAVGDFNGDGNQDLVVANTGSDNVSILLGNGAGGFSVPMNFAANLAPISVAVGDFNGDGNQDLVVANHDDPASDVSILLGDGMGNFTGPTAFYTGSLSYLWAVAVGDLNGDNKQDLVVANDAAVILLGNGDGSFGPHTEFAAGDLPFSVAVGDFNGDGSQDLAVANNNSDDVSILLHSCPTPTLGNYPATSVQLSRNTTVMPTAAPANVTNITASTSTNFKGQLVADPITGAVRVADAYPAGTYNVTVKAFDGNGPTVTKTFTLTVTTPPTCTPVSFGTTSFAAGSEPISVAVGDFNGDGNQDLAVANDSSDSVSVFSGNGAGFFFPLDSFTVGDAPQAVAAGDFNGDGKEDLAVANFNSDNVSIFLGNGGGTFGAANDFVAGDGPRSITVGDFNGDGRPDLAVVNSNSNDASILLGDGAGHFGAASNFGTGTLPRFVAVGDFNGDSKQDLAVANQTSNNVSILLGDGAGSFGAATHFPAGTGLRSLAIADFNGDNKQDLAVANFGSNNVSVFLGDGAGGFGSATNFGAGTGPFSVAVGDFNGDQKQDLAIANFGSDNLTILLGGGAGNFTSSITFATGTDPASVAVGDFNNDAKQDLAVANFTSNNVSILLRDCTPTFTSAVSRKAHGAAGNFDINLPVTGTPGVECRSGGGTNDFTMVVSFTGSVTVNGNPQAQVSVGTGLVGSGGVSNGGAVTVSGNIVTIPLTVVADQQTINVTLNGVNSTSIDQPAANVVIPMSRLLGDTSGNGSVNASDVSQTKARIGQAVTSANFRSDVNANGSINSTDASQVKANSGHAVP